MTIIITKERQVAIANALYSGKTITAILCLGALTADSTLAQVLAAEVASSFGYARQTAVAGTSTYDAMDNRAEIPQLSFNFAADEGTIQWDAIAYLVGNGTTFEDVALLDTEAPTQNIFPNQQLNLLLDLATLAATYV